MISGVKCSLTLQVKMAPSYRIQLTQAMGSLNKTSPCKICCGRGSNMSMYHQHFSTAYFNKQMVLKGDMRPQCYFCDTRHPIDHRTRQNVILSTSTLSGVPYLTGWGWGDERPTHCDMETIPGGKIVTLRKAWERAYSSNPLPIDTVLVAGLNDVRDLYRLYKDKHSIEELAELVSDDIIDAIEFLLKVVKQHSVRFDVDDTLAVSTILHVPAMYWHDDDGNYPTANYVNLKEVVDKTNLKIAAFNLKNRMTAPKLHQSGERSLKHGKKRVFMWNAWREEDKHNMMHLKDQHRFKMVRLVVKHFEKSTPRSVQHLD